MAGGGAAPRAGSQGGAHLGLGRPGCGTFRTSPEQPPADRSGWPSRPHQAVLCRRPVPAPAPGPGPRGSWWVARAQVSLGRGRCLGPPCIRPEAASWRVLVSTGSTARRPLRTRPDAWPVGPVGTGRLRGLWPQGLCRARCPGAGAEAPRLPSGLRLGVGRTGTAGEASCVRGGGAAVGGTRCPAGCALSSGRVTCVCPPCHRHLLKGVSPRNRQTGEEPCRARRAPRTRRRSVFGQLGRRLASVPTAFLHVLGRRGPQPRALSSAASPPLPWLAVSRRGPQSPPDPGSVSQGWVGPPRFAPRLVRRP